MGRIANLALSRPISLVPGEYTVYAKQIHLKCWRCGGVDILDPKHIAPSGVVSPAWCCPSVECGAADYVTLGDFDVARDDS